ncbi:FHA domain-containing protein [Kaarinaea lacus]
MATLQKLGDDALCPLNISKMRIGRASDNEIIIQDESVSGYHAVISMRKGETEAIGDIYVIEDLGSTNKTHVNNNEIDRHELKDGDIIRIGRTRLKFSTKDYVPPKTNFQATQKLSKSSILGYLFPKKVS